mmetsp:Transcript_23426/g.44085  ORF Transcript_23426/g.44085 Transcript_23426/m.44085 type:complete len:200 (+) Transcript_23426:171-770(+)
MIRVRVLLTNCKFNQTQIHLLEAVPERAVIQSPALVTPRHKMHHPRPLPADKDVLSPALFAVELSLGAYPCRVHVRVVLQVPRAVEVPRQLRFDREDCVEDVLVVEARGPAFLGARLYVRLEGGSPKVLPTLFLHFGASEGHDTAYVAVAVPIVALFQTNPAAVIGIIIISIDIHSPAVVVPIVWSPAVPVLVHFGRRD